MNLKSPYKALRKPICTWLSLSDYELFCALAASIGVTPAAYLRSIVVDALAEERERGLPTRQDSFGADVR
jgi:hypothetical protein